MPASGQVQKGTKQFMRQGHTTSNANGFNYLVTAKGVQGEAAKEIKP